MKDSSVLVWHVFGTMDVGGAELRTLELGLELQAHGCRFEYVALSGRFGTLAEEIVAAGGAVHPMRLSLSFPIRFYRALRRSRPDVLDSHVATFSGALIFLAWIARIPIRVTHFRSDSDGHIATLRRRLQRAIMRRFIRTFATDMVGVAPAALEFGYRADWRRDTRAQVIPNGIRSSDVMLGNGELRTAINVSPHVTLLLHVGRPSVEKNRSRTVTVLAAIRRAGLDAHLVLVGGDGIDTEDLHTCIGDSHMEGFVHELGQRRSVRELMAQSDVLLLTSVREGLPGVVLEALSVGTPVVASDLPGVRFIAQHLPGVYPVALNSDQPWLVAVNAALRRPRDVTARVERIKQFNASPFAMKRSVAAHKLLYQRKLV